MKISKIILSIFAVLTLNSTYAQEGFSIKGRVNLAEEGSIVTIQYYDAGKSNLDSAKVHNGTFQFTGKVSESTKATMTLNSLKKDSGPISLLQILELDKQEFFLENVPIQVYGQKVKTALILGGSVQNDFLRLQYLLAPIEAEMKPQTEKVVNYYKEHNALPPDSVLKPLRDLGRKTSKVQDEFVSSFPDSYVSLNIVTSSSVAITDVDLTEKSFQKLSPRMKNTSAGKELFARIEISKKIKIGEPAIEIAQKNTKDKKISTKSLKGKYVLIDFWASWCGPCRHENPNLVRTYNMFKNKNFEIYAVSLDQDKAAWLKAIKDDGLPWIHVSELNGWRNSAAQNYGVRAVPQNFLVGPDGKIVAINLTGERLTDKLRQLLGT